MLKVSSRCSSEGFPGWLSYISRQLITAQWWSLLGCEDSLRYSPSTSVCARLARRSLLSSSSPWRRGRGRRMLPAAPPGQGERTKCWFENFERLKKMMHRLEKSQTAVFMFRWWPRLIFLKNLFFFKWIYFIYLCICVEAIHCIFQDVGQRLFFSFCFSVNVFQKQLWVKEGQEGCSQLLKTWISATSLYSFLCDFMTFSAFSSYEVSCLKSMQSAGSSSHSWGVKAAGVTRRLPGWKRKKVLISLTFHSALLCLQIIKIKSFKCVVLWLRCRACSGNDAELQRGQLAAVSLCVLKYFRNVSWRLHEMLTAGTLWRNGPRWSLLNIT